MKVIYKYDDSKNNDGRYACNAIIMHGGSYVPDPLEGYGTGETTTAARAAAIADLQTRVTALLSVVNNAVSKELTNAIEINKGLMSQPVKDNGFGDTVAKMSALVNELKNLKSSAKPTADESKFEPGSGVILCDIWMGEINGEIVTRKGGPKSRVHEVISVTEDSLGDVYLWVKPLDNRFTGNPYMVLANHCDPLESYSDAQQQFLYEM